MEAEISDGYGKLTQTMKIEAIAREWGVTDSKRTFPTSGGDRVADNQTVDATKYRHFLGAIAYVGRLTRPDIAFAVAYLQRYQQLPEGRHMRMLGEIIEYLFATKSKGLVFERVPDDEYRLEGYVDADFADCPETRKSTTGYVFTLGGTPIQWSSRRQKLVTTSSTEAEYVAATEAVCEGLWLHRVTNELGLKSEKLLLHEDNTSVINRCIKGAHEFHRRSKHIDVKFHFIRDQVQKGNVDIQYVNTHENPADVMTKLLSGTEFGKKVDYLVRTNFARARTCKRSTGHSVTLSRRT